MINANGYLGVPGNRYRPVDYEAMQSIIRQKKQEGFEAKKKINALQKDVKLRKDELMLKQHKAYWIKQIKRILSEQKRLTSDVNVCVFENRIDPIVGSAFVQVAAEKESQEADLKVFREQTVQPVLLLRQDLKKWVDFYPSVTDANFLEMEDPDIVIETIDKICANQMSIMEELLKQKNSLESQLNIEGHVDRKVEDVRSMRHAITTGIPEAGFSLECPDEELKVKVLQEFIQIDGRYVEVLHNLDSQYSHYKNPRGDWSEGEDALFSYASEMYSSYDVENRRALFFDIARRLLPNKSRDEIMEHEDRYNRLHFFCDREKQILVAWQRDRAELFNKACVIFEDATNASIFDELRKENAEKRRKQAKAFYDKLQIWREKKMELQQLESEVEEARRKDVEQSLAREREIERRKKKKVPTATLR